VRANISVLNNINTSAQSIRQELENYIGNKNQAHIDNALNQADQALAIYMSQLPSGSPAAEAEAALGSFRQTSRAAVEELKGSEEALKQQIVGLEQRIQEQDQRIVAAQAEIDSSKQDLATTVATSEANFNSLRTQLESDFASLQEALKGSFQTQLQTAKNLADATLDELDQKKRDAAAIVQSVGDILTTGTYKDTAETESKLANRYRAVTIGLFGVGILIVVSNFILHAIAALKGTPFEETPWMIASRFATAIAVALPALYTARESARHRTTADRARQRELELTTLGPFIELLPNDKKAEIRDRLTDRYFGVEVEAHEVHSPIDAETAAKLLEAVAKLKP
jgi:hypothetical protein